MNEWIGPINSGQLTHQLARRLGDEWEGGRRLQAAETIQRSWKRYVKFWVRGLGLALMKVRADLYYFGSVIS